MAAHEADFSDGGPAGAFPVGVGAGVWECP